MNESFSLRVATENDITTVQRIFEASPTYFKRVEGVRSLDGMAIKEMTDSPPKEKQQPSYRKVFCLLLFDDEPVGVLDIHKDHPEVGICYLGLFLLTEEQHGRGIGSAFYHICEQFIQSEFGSTSIRLGVNECNDVEGFWSHVGFKRNGRTYIWKGSNKESQVFEMEKPLC